MTTLIIATRNRHKVEEIREILGAGFDCLTLADFPNAPEVIEDAGTFAGNATKKAVELARWLSESGNMSESATQGQPLVLADDSGLEVDALGGAPGVNSARYAALDSRQEGNSSSAENNAKLLMNLRNVTAEKRAARFRCVVAIAPVLPRPMVTASPACAADEHELQTEIFEGACEGRIEMIPRGTAGFGYDPLFTPEGYSQTFGELSEETKNQLSHRAKALLQFKNRFKSRVQK